MSNVCRWEYNSMKCPVCKDLRLVPTTLESDLRTYLCNSCLGHWIEANDYWDWLDRHGERLKEKEPDLFPIVVSDIQKAKLCPYCQRIMLRYKVGHGLQFTLDQCGSCNGFWFDANEWEALRERNLHDEVHLVFSAPWQADVRKEEARQVLEGIYQDAFGKDREKLREIKQWIDRHPQKDKILDYLASSEP